MNLARFIAPALLALAVPAALAQGLSMPGVITPESQRRALQTFPLVDDAALRERFRVIRGYPERSTNSYVWDLEPAEGGVGTMPELIADYEMARGRTLPGSPVKISENRLGLQARLELPPGNDLAAVDRIVIRARPRT